MTDLDTRHPYERALQAATERLARKQAAYDTAFAANESKKAEYAESGKPTLEGERKYPWTPKRVPRDLKQVRAAQAAANRELAKAEKATALLSLALRARHWQYSQLLEEGVDDVYAVRRPADDARDILAAWRHRIQSHIAFYESTLQLTSDLTHYYDDLDIDVPGTALVDLNMLLSPIAGVLQEALQIVESLPFPKHEAAR